MRLFIIIVGLSLKFSLHAVAQVEKLTVREISQGNYVHLGHFPPASSDNHADVANIGFIVGEKCVLVIDAGNTIDIGERLREAVASITDRPICAIAVTHVHPDHLLGINAFTDLSGLAIYGHHRLPKQIKRRSRYYLENLRDTLDLQSTQRYRIETDNFTLVDGTVELDLGNRIVQLSSWGPAHTDHDLTVWDTRTRTFWSGDLVFSDHVPILDSNIRGFAKVLDELFEMDPDHYVVGHGSLDLPWKSLVAKQRHYLSVLMDETRYALRHNQSLIDAVNQVGWSERDKWINFDKYHRRNVTTSFTDLEWED